MLIFERIRNYVGILFDFPDVKGTVLFLVPQVS